MDERIYNITRALAFIEGHLRDDICVTDMARECGYSLYHFIRLFNQLVHHTPYDYLIRRRLAQAAEELLISPRRLIDIAVDYRFQTAESFTRAFNRVYHVLPSQARKTQMMDRRLILQPRTARHLIHYQRQACLQPERMKTPERFIVGLPLERAMTAELVSELAGLLEVHTSQEHDWYWIEMVPKLVDREASSWGRMVPELVDYEASPRGRMVPELVEGSSPVGASDPGCKYFFGYEVPDCASLPLGLCARRLPACQWSAQAHSGKMEDIDLTRDYLYQTWLANSTERVGLPLEMDVIRIKKDCIGVLVCMPIIWKEDANSG